MLSNFNFSMQVNILYISLTTEKKSIYNTIKLTYEINSYWLSIGERYKTYDISDINAI